MKELTNTNSKDFLDLLPEIIFEVDKDLKIKFLNNSFKDVLGYDKDLFLNKKFPINKILHPDDLPLLKNSITKIYNGEISTGNAYRVFNSKNEIVTLEIYNSVIKDNGEISGLRCIAVNITEREKKHQELSSQEKYYRLIFENSPIPYQSLSEDGKFLNVNPAWEKVLLFGKNDVLGKSFRDLICDEDKSRFDNSFLSLLTHGQINSLELKLKTKSNDIIFANFSCKVEYDEKNNYYRSHCVFSDITTQKLAERTLLESEKRLKELNATKDKFFSIIAHDLKNPFNDLMGFSQLLDLNIEKYDNNKIKQFVNIIHQSSKLAYNLLENLLDWSRSQTGTINFNPENISLNLIIEETVDLLESTARNKNIKIYSDHSEEIHAFADQNMIRTVIRNLISNAIKYTNQGGHIKIITNKNQTECKVTIEDNGIGISEKNLSKIFKIDESYSTLGTEHEKGTGLGLILCKEFIDRNEGTLAVHSEINKGSIFSFTIPAEKKM